MCPRPVALLPLLAALPAAFAAAAVLLAPVPPPPPPPPAAAAPALPPAAPDRVPVGPEATAPSLPLSPALARALARREHDRAVALLEEMDASALSGAERADRAFLLAWERLRTADREDERRSARELEAVRASRAPTPYVDLVVGELLAADGRPVEAAELLARVPDDAPVSARARLAEGAAWWAAGATARARAAWEELAGRDDPAPGVPEALLALADRSTAEAAEPLLRRLWARYPATPEGREAAERLRARPGWAPTPAEVAARATALMDAGLLARAIALVEARRAVVEADPAARCEALYALGRSLYRRGGLTRAAEILGPLAEDCARAGDADRAAKALYLAGKAKERLRAWAEAAAFYRRIPDLAPDHTMADDGLALAGIALQHAGRPDEAEALWAEQVERWPEGDMAAESLWRLAWVAWLRGDVDEAIRRAEVLAGTRAGEPRQRVAGLYWAARWRALPSPDRPAEPNPDPAALQAGLAGLADVCLLHPDSYYALHAASWLRRLAPEVLALVPPPAREPPGEALSVRAAFLERPEARRGLALARLGLAAEALAELEAALAALDDPPLASEQALLARVEAAIDPVAAHERLHHHLLRHGIARDDPDRAAVEHLAWPDLYWDEVQAAVAATGGEWDPRLLHALVREESGFDPSARSHAGARGLAQLMPRTARDVARRAGVPLPRGALEDPATNLRLGATYLDELLRRWAGDPFRAVASYNAGPGNVARWTRERPGLPADAWVESIPIRETRRYVKRVLETWQRYRLLYDPDPTPPELPAPAAD